MTKLCDAHRSANLSPLSLMSKSVTVHDLFPSSVVISDLGVKIYHHDSEVSTWTALYDGLQSAVKLVLAIFAPLVCRGVALNDVHVDFLLLSP